MDKIVIREGQTHYSASVPAHGLFEVQVGVYRATLQRYTKAQLLQKVVDIYEGSKPVLGKHYGVSYWRQYPKGVLALIAANCEA